jgi:chemotaxis protein CheX
VEKQEKKDQDIICGIELKEVEAEFVNPFLTALFDTLTALGSKPREKGRLTLKMLSRIQFDASVLLRISGSLHGAVIFGMTEEVALKFASAFLMNIPVESLDDMAKSALVEFSLRVTEKAKARLIDKGFHTNVSYSFYHNKALKFADDTSFLQVPFNTEHGTIRVLINLSKNLK